MMLIIFSQTLRFFLNILTTGLATRWYMIFKKIRCLTDFLIIGITYNSSKERSELESTTYLSNLPDAYFLIKVGSTHFHAATDVGRFHVDRF